jgi:hypothetical protein
MMATLVGAFFSGFQLAFVALAFVAGVALVAIISLCLFWFFHGLIQAIAEKLLDRWGKP